MLRCPVPGYRVSVIGKKPVESTPLAPLPRPTSPYAVASRPAFEPVELLFPRLCPCCAGEVEEGSYLDVSKFKGWGGFAPATLDNWQVPYCRDCLAHIALKQHRPTSSVILEIAMVLAIIIIVFPLIGTHAILAAFVFLALVLTLIFVNAWILRRYEREKVRPLLKPSCVAPSPAITYQGWNSDNTQHLFLILNETYAKAFAQLNHSQSITPLK